MSNQKKNDFEIELLKADEIISTKTDLPIVADKIIFSRLIPSVLLPIVDTLASPYYKKKLIEAQESIKNNTVIANERKYRAIIDLIRDLTLADKMTPELLELLESELEKLK